MRTSFCNSQGKFKIWKNDNNGFNENTKYKKIETKRQDGKGTVSCERHQFVKKHGIDKWSIVHLILASLATVFSFGIAYKKSTTIREWFARKEVIYVDVAKASLTTKKVDKVAENKKVFPNNAKKKPTFPSKNQQTKKSNPTSQPTKVGEGASKPGKEKPPTPAAPSHDDGITIVGDVSEKPLTKLENYLGASNSLNAVNSLKLWTPGSWFLRKHAKNRSFIFCYNNPLNVQGRQGKKGVVSNYKEYTLTGNLPELNKKKQELEQRTLDAYNTANSTIPEANRIFAQLAVRTSDEAFSEFLSQSSVYSLFTNTGCPAKTAKRLDGKESSYLHINEVKISKNLTCFASQAPLKKPPEFEALEQWWKWASENAGIIIDFTSERDNYIYYPTQVRDTSEIGSLAIECTNIQAFYEGIKGLSSSTYQIHDKFKNTTKEIKRLHYNQWLDYSAAQTERMVELATFFDGLKVSKPPLIHCRAGVGRTGTFITTIAIKQLIDQKKVTSDTNVEETVIQLILLGRKARGPMYVQTPEQLDSILKFIPLYFSRIEEYKTILQKPPTENWKMSASETGYVFFFKDYRGNSRAISAHYRSIKDIESYVKARQVNFAKHQKYDQSINNGVEAAAFLKNKVPGEYLLRYSQRQKDFVFSYKMEDGRIGHTLMQQALQVGNTLESLEREMEEIKTKAQAKSSS